MLPVWCDSEIISVISANVQRFHPSIVFDCVAMIVGVVSLSSRNKFYLIVVDVFVAISTVLTFTLLIRRRINVVVVLAFVCVISLLYFLTQWIRHFRKLSQEGRESCSLIT